MMEARFRRKRRRSERHCASTGPEHGSLYDLAGVECADALYGDRRPSGNGNLCSMQKRRSYSSENKGSVVQISVYYV